MFTLAGPLVESVRSPSKNSGPIAPELCGAFPSTSSTGSLQIPDSRNIGRSSDTSICSRNIFVVFRPRPCNPSPPRRQRCRHDHKLLIWPLDVPSIYEVTRCALVDCRAWLLAQG